MYNFFWETLVLLLEDNCSFENLILNTSDILFGNSKFDEILNKIILWDKKHIFRAKSEGNLPSFNAFLRLIASHYKTEAYEGKAKSSWTFLITFIIDVRLFSYFHKCNNGLLSTFM